MRLWTKLRATLFMFCPVPSHVLKMPTYEYQCSTCQHNFEIYQSFSAPPVTQCPECKAETVSIKISGGAGVMFKGGGFYETDYKKGKGSDYHNQKESEGGPKKESDSTTAPSVQNADKSAAPAKSEPSLATSKSALSQSKSESTTSTVKPVTTKAEG